MRYLDFHVNFYDGYYGYLSIYIYIIGSKIRSIFVAFYVNIYIYSTETIHFFWGLYVTKNTRIVDIHAKFGVVAFLVGYFFSLAVSVCDCFSLFFFFCIWFVIGCCHWKEISMLVSRKPIVYFRTWVDIVVNINEGRLIELLILGVDEYKHLLVPTNHRPYIKQGL